MVGVDDTIPVTCYLLEIPDSDGSCVCGGLRDVVSWGWGCGKGVTGLERKCDQSS